MKNFLPYLPQITFAKWVTVGFVYRVTERQQKNMMNGENLAIVFAPTLLRTPETDPLTSLTAVKFERELIEILIGEQARIFDTWNLEQPRIYKFVHKVNYEERWFPTVILLLVRIPK